MWCPLPLAVGIQALQLRPQENLQSSQAPHEFNTKHSVALKVTGSAIALCQMMQMAHCFDHFESAK
jgi:hypothetical protein